MPVILMKVILRMMRMIVQVPPETLVFFKCNFLMQCSSVQRLFCRVTAVENHLKMTKGKLDTMTECQQCETAEDHNKTINVLDL